MKSQPRQSPQPRQVPSRSAATAAAGESPSAGPGFALDLIGGHGVLSTQARTVGVVLLRALSMEVPRIAFPVDVSGGPDRFKNRRCSVRHLALELTSGALQQLLDAAGLEEHGLTGVQIAVHPLFLALTGTWHVGSAQASFTCRVALLPQLEHEVQLVFYDVRVYGWLPLPGAVLPQLLRRALGWAPLEAHGCSIWRLQPAREVLRELLPRSGWKVPSLCQAAQMQIELSRGHLVLTAGSDDSLQPQASTFNSAGLQASEAAAGVAAAESALAEGDVAAAYQLWREAYDEGHGGSWVQTRLLQAAVADPQLWDEAQQLAHEMLALDPDCAAAHLALASLAHKEGAPLVAMEHLQHLAGLSQDLSERFESMAAELAMGIVAEGIDPNAALAAYRRAAARAPKTTGIYAHLFALCCQLERHEEALQALQQWAKQLTEPRELARLHCQAGQLYLGPLNDLRQARAFFDRALRAQSNHPDALEGLAETHARRGEHGRAASILARLVETAEQAGDRQRILALNLRLGQLWHEVLGDVDAAAGRLRRVLDLAPEHVGARLRLAQIALAKGDRPWARQLYLEVVELDRSDDAVVAVVDLGLAHRRLADLYGEGETAADAAAVIDNLAAAERLLPEDVTIRSDLLAALRRAGDGARLLQALQSALATVQALTPRHALLVEVAEVALQQQDAVAAAAHARSAWTLMPDDPVALGLLLRALACLGDVEGLQQVVASAASQTAEGAEQATLWLQLAAILKDMGAGQAARLAAIDAAQAAAPRHLAAAEMRVELLTASGDVPAQLLALQQLGALAEGEIAANAHLSAARLLWSHQQDASAALAAADRAIAAHGRNQIAHLLQAEIRLATGDVSAARRGLEQAATYFGSEVPVSLRLRQAALAQQVGEPLAEAQALQAAVAMGAALGPVWQRIIDTLVAAGELQPALAQLEAWAAARLLPAGEIWLRAASLLAATGDRTAATTYLQRALQSREPAIQQAAGAQWEALARATGQNTEVLKALQLQLQLAPASAQPALQLRLMQAQLSNGDADAAQATCEALLQVAPQLGAAQCFLAERLAARGAWQRCLDQTLYLVQLDEGGGLSHESLHAAYARAAALAAAIRPGILPALERRFALAYPGAAPDALKGDLETQLRQADQWEPLLALYRLQLSQATAAARPHLCYQLAVLLVTPLGRVEEALPLLRESLVGAPEQSVAVNLLTELYTKLERWEPLAEMHHALAEVLAEPGLAMLQAVAAARIYLQQLGDAERAAQLLQNCMLRMQLPLSPELQSILTELGLYSELVELLDRSLSMNMMAEDGRLQALCDLLLGPVPDLARALKWAQHAIDVAPGSDVPRRLELTILDREPKLGHSREALARWASSRSGAAQAEILMALVQRHEAAGDATAANAALEGAVAADATQSWALDMLLERHTALAQWPQAVSVLHRLLPISEPAVRPTLLRRLATLADRCSDSQSAAGALAQLSTPSLGEQQHLVSLYLKIGNFEALGRMWEVISTLPPDLLEPAAEELILAGELGLARTFLAPLLRLPEYHDAVWVKAGAGWRALGRLVELARWRLQWAAEAPPAARAWLRLVAHAELIEAGEPIDGLTWSALEPEVSGLDLQQPQVAWAVLQVAQALGQRDWVARSLAHMAPDMDEDDARLLPVLRARVAVELDGGDPERAVALARRLVLLGDPDAVNWLSRALEKAGRTPELLDLLEQRVQRGGPIADVLQLQIATLHDTEGRPDEALAALAKVGERSRGLPWSQLSWRLGQLGTPGRMQVAAAAICARVTLNVVERAGWLRAQARVLWRHLDEGAAAQPLLHQAHLLAPQTVAQVLAAVAAEPQSAMWLLQEAIVVIPSAATAPLWHALAKVSEGEAVMQALEHSCTLAGVDGDQAALAAVAATAAALGEQQLRLRATGLLYGLAPQEHGASHCAALAAVADWAQLRALLLQRVELHGEPGVVAALLTEAAEVSIRLEEPAAALSHLRAAIAHETTAARLQWGLLLAADDPAQVVSWTGQLAAHADVDPALRPTLLRQQFAALKAAGREAEARQVQAELVAEGWGSSADVVALAEREEDAGRAAVLLEQAAAAVTALEAGPFWARAASAWSRAGSRPEAARCLQEALLRGHGPAAVQLAVLEVDDRPSVRQAARLAIWQMQADTAWLAPARVALRFDLVTAAEERADWAQAEVLLAEVRSWEMSATWARRLAAVLAAQDKQVLLALHQVEHHLLWPEDEAVAGLRTATQVLEPLPGEARGLAAAWTALAARRPDDESSVLGALAAVAALGDADLFAASVMARWSAAAPALAVAVALHGADLWVRRWSSPDRALQLLQQALQQQLHPALLDAWWVQVQATETYPAAMAYLVEQAMDQPAPLQAPLWLLAARAAAATHDDDLGYGHAVRALRGGSRDPWGLSYALQQARLRRRWGEVVEVLLQQAEALQAGAPAAAAACLRQAATVALDDLSDPVQAQSLLRRSLALAVETATVMALLQLLVGAGDFAAAALLLQQGPVAPAEGCALGVTVLAGLGPATAAGESLVSWLIEHYPEAPAVVAQRLDQLRRRGDPEALLGDLNDQLAACPAAAKPALWAEAAAVAVVLQRWEQAYEHAMAASEGSAAAAALPLWVLAYQAAQALESPARQAQVIVLAAAHVALLQVQATQQEAAASGPWHQLLAAAAYAADNLELAESTYVSLLGAALPWADAAATHLAEIYARQGNHAALAALWQRQLALAPGEPAVTAALAYRLGVLLGEQLQDAAAAQAAWQQALVADPAHRPAHLALGLQLAATGQAAAAIAALVPWVEWTEAAPSAPIEALYAAYRSVGDLAAAIPCGSWLLRRQPVTPARLQAHAELLEAGGQLPAASVVYLEALEQLGDDASLVARTARIWLHTRLASLAWARRDGSTASEHLRLALALGPPAATEGPLYAQLATIYAAQERWPAALAARGEVASREPDGPTRAQAYLSLAIAYEDLLQDTATATLLFERAQGLLPREPGPLLALQERHRASGNVPKYLLVAEQLLQLGAPEVCTPAWLIEVAAAYEAVDPARAQALYVRAQAADPSLPGLAQRRLQVAQAQDDPRQLVLLEEEALRQVVDPTMRASRYAALATVYLERLQDVAGGTAALQAACAAAPQEQALWRRLADTHALAPATYLAAVTLYQQLLAATPLDLTLLRVMARLYGQLQQVDRAYGHYAALLCLLPGDPESQRFVAACRGARPPSATRLPSEMDWLQSLQHAQQRGPVEDLFAPLARFTELAFVDGLAAWGIEPSRDRLGADHSAAAALHGPLVLLGQEGLGLYAWSAGEAGCALVLQARPASPALLLGTTLLSPMHQRQLVFMGLRWAALHRSGHCLVAQLPSGRLPALLAALCLAVDPTATPPGLDEEAAGWAVLMARPMTPQIRASMLPRVQAYLKVALSSDLERWRSAAVATAERLALLLGSDVEEAVRGLQAARGLQIPSGGDLTSALQATPGELDLYCFAVSEAYFNLRESLGLALRPR